MQQFTVPQFIDVENKIIGPITTRQFMIFLFTAVIIGISYKLFDFSLFLTISIFLVIVASVFSFVKINGRPFHHFLLNIIQTLKKPGLRVWNNKAIPVEKKEIEKVNKNDITPLPKKHYKKSRLAELSLIVDTKGRYKG